MADTITIQTDAGALSLPAGSTLAQAVELIQARGAARGEERVATAVNGEFVASSRRADHVLCDGDTVLCFQAITGG